MDSNETETYRTKVDENIEYSGTVILSSEIIKKINRNVNISFLLGVE